MKIGVRLPAWLAGAAAALLLVGCGGAGTSSGTGTSGSTGSGGGTGTSSGRGSGSGQARAGAPKPRSSATTLAADMKSAVRSAGSVHIAGHLTLAGKTLGLNIGVLRSGQLSGTITQNGVPLQVIATGGKAYVKATAAFLNQLSAPAGVCNVICGKYVELSASETQVLTQSLSLASLTRSMTRKTPAFANGGTATVDGQQVDVLRTARGVTVDVAAAGSHYPLAVASAARHDELNFSQWDHVPAPAAPPKSEIVNVGNLG